MLQDVRRFALLLILIPTFALAAGRQDANAHGHRATAEPDWSELMATMKTMDAAMSSVQPSPDSDINFVRLMLPHHQAAIEMAKTQLLYGKDPQLCRLAQEIITDQQSEIQLMQLWLKQHGANSQDSSPARAPHVNEQQ
jgi:uncharacterized protein (DUF305 family)